ncbi:Zn-ribbon domain-containing OB-fold protein [Gordonia insulae]|uniref:DUF35 domain-containing protein n=1 Tax=Gordonia insulae TaxID=2420509 RepID=A0A3G8JKF9_9ACTN|nr:OB-fold domain-containing protein [Gordonia insulae]AZG45483.1 hypothetical protein D7316_02079 [Gordonia insulae]
MALKSIAERLFVEVDDGVQLIGGRCDDCNEVFFPTRSTCGRCQSEHVTDETLPRRGKVWTWTSQSFLPKEPYNGSETEADFEAFVVGYIDLPGACIVQGRIDVPADRAVELADLGTEVESFAYEFRRRSDGEMVHTYAFRPVVTKAGETK